MKRPDLRTDLDEIDALITRLSGLRADPTDQMDAFIGELQAVLLECRSTLARLDRSSSTELEPFVHVTLEAATGLLGKAQPVSAMNVERAKLEERLTSLKTALAQRVPRGRLAAGGLSAALSAREGYHGRVLQAAAFPPAFLHDLCTQHLPDSLKDWKGDWQGFIEFGDRLGPNAHRGEVIDLPRYFVFTPFQNWWMISHEAWHTLYTRAFEREYGWVIDELKLRHGGSSIYGMPVVRMTRELFANWMDFVYCFQGSSDVFQRLVWSHWSRLYLSRQLPEEYLLRAFLVFVYAEGEVPELQKLADELPTAMPSRLEELWGRYVAMLDSLDTASSEIVVAARNQARDIAPIARPFIDLIAFFHCQMLFPNLQQAFGENSSEAELEGLSRALLDDAAPSVQAVVNPVALLLKTAQLSLDSTHVPTAQQTAALMYSLARGRSALIDRIDQESDSESANQC